MTREERLHAEHGIACQIFVAVQEEVRDEGAISGCAYHEVDMGRPEGMASHRGKKLAGMGPSFGIG